MNTIYNLLSTAWKMRLEKKAKRRSIILRTHCRRSKKTGEGRLLVRCARGVVPTAVEDQEKACFVLTQNRFTHIYEHIIIPLIRGSAVLSLTTPSSMEAPPASYLPRLLLCIGLPMYLGFPQCPPCASWDSRSVPHSWVVGGHYHYHHHHP